MSDLLQKSFKGKVVLVTGHTGFKGSWLSLWLTILGAKVVGYSLDPMTSPNHFSLCSLQDHVTDIRGDVRDFDKLNEVIKTHKPEIIFHMAAQPLVLDSYESPRETFDINAGGTVNILEAARLNPGIKALLLITTDKVYENRNWIWGYRESDALGGSDPYSASKGMAEIAAASYRSSFFHSGTNKTSIATVRAGNIIGGGDFSKDRLVPDTISALMNGEPVQVRNPNSIRPWLHVLEPLSGYLLLAAKMVEDASYGQAWNFGPLEHQAITCRQLVEKTIELWGTGEWVDASRPTAKKEMEMLRLNWDKAANKLSWQPCYSWSEAVFETVRWFLEMEKHSGDPVAMLRLSIDHIHAYSALAEKRGLCWANTTMPAAVP